MAHKNHLRAVEHFRSVLPRSLHVVMKNVAASPSIFEGRYTLVIFPASVVELTSTKSFLLSFLAMFVEATKNLPSLTFALSFDGGKRIVSLELAVKLYGVLINMNKWKL